MTATDIQVKIAMREINKGRTREQAAAKANLGSRKTVGKYMRLGRLPSALKVPRTYRTRPNPFVADWALVEERLQIAPQLEGKALFEWLCAQRPERYHAGQLRTFQRHVGIWRAFHSSQLLSLPQIHRPGEVLQTDGTHMNALGITLAGQPFPHLLMHTVLPYSNWEWGCVAQSESLLAIQTCLYAALLQLGHVPAVHQTDNMTAATHRLAGDAPAKPAPDVGTPAATPGHAPRDYNVAYLAMLAPLGITPRTIHIQAPDEQGDVEAAQGALKRAVEQELLLRGSRDFADGAQYEAFLWALMQRRNALRAAQLAEELAVMPMLRLDLPQAIREYAPRVGPSGTIRVLNTTYSVPSGLVGRIVQARVSEWQLEIWYANQCVVTLPRLTRHDAHRIDYRHVIDSLLRKPGGFRRYRYQDDLFPQAVFRQAWEALCARLPERQADLAYLRILKLAAVTLTCDVADVLHELLTSDAPWDDHTVSARLQPQATPVPDVAAQVVNLGEYDALLTLSARLEASHAPA